VILDLLLNAQKDNNTNFKDLQDGIKLLKCCMDVEITNMKLMYGVLVVF
jgi:hypothetical protein